MSDVTVSSNVDGKNAIVSIRGRFDFSAHSAFREAYEKVQLKGGKYVIDMSGTEYMDSSALGMLLLLRDHFGGDGADITIKNCRPEIKNILSIANFQNLFKIS